jgi:hypothetical protein
VSKAAKAEARRIKRLYRWLTWQPDLEAAVRDLTTRSLRELNGYLARKGATSGVPAMIHGLILYEAAGRLMLQSDTKES